MKKTKVLVAYKKPKKKVLVKKASFKKSGAANIDVMNLVPGARDMTNV